MDLAHNNCDRKYTSHITLAHLIFWFSVLLNCKCTIKASRRSFDTQQLFKRLVELKQMWNENERALNSSITSNEGCVVKVARYIIPAVCNYMKGRGKLSAKTKKPLRRIWSGMTLNMLQDDGSFQSLLQLCFIRRHASEWAEDYFMLILDFYSRVALCFTGFDIVLAINRFPFDWLVLYNSQ